METISIFDRLTVGLKTTPGHLVTSDWPELPQENTITKTLRLCEEFAVLPPLEVHLHKVIPDRAGLGGGSSNAAGLLKSIAKIVPSLEPRQIEEVACAVGMDVPFFLVGGRACAEGYGEKVTAVSEYETRWYVVVKPECGCSTLEMYQKLDANEYPWREIRFDELYNDFESVVPAEISDLMELMRLDSPTNVALSGSGSAVFAEFGSEKEANDFRSRFKAPHGAKVFTTQTVRSDQYLIRVIDS